MENKKQIKKIVLVDASGNFKKAMQVIVARFCKARCVFFKNPTDAQQYIKNSADVDILITAYQMPDINGFELAKLAIEKNPKIQVIVHTESDIKSLTAVCTQYGLEGKVTLQHKNVIFI